MNLTITQTNERKTNPFLEILRIRNFRLLWIGEAISVLGDHFYIVALPWLVLQLTGDALVVGAVLALAAVPRAALMLVGGALSDRFPPRNIMLASNLARFILVSLLAGLVFTNRVEIWMLYALAILFGIADAFLYPAHSAMAPQLVKKDLLQAANSLMQGTYMLTMLAGPVLAGLLIAALGDGHAKGVNMQGIAAALGLDAISFLGSLVTLLLINQPRAETSRGKESILESIRSGLVFVWNDIPLRAFFLVVAAVTFFFDGPFIIGVPLLADTRFPEGAVAYGAILSARGLGSLLGVAFAGVLPQPNPKRRGAVLLALAGGMGIGLALLGISSSTNFAAVIGLAVGVFHGYILVFLVTWVQSRPPEEFVGRLMSLLLFASTGLIPVSMAVSGVVSRVDVTGLLVVSGTLIILISLAMLFNPTVRAMEPNAAQAGD
jgi:hypothetical protein